MTAPLVLVGPDAGAEADLARLVEKAHLGDAVLRLGRVPTAVLPALYRGARLVLYLSRCEGFGLPVLEAMACGAPLVASRIPALEEVAGDAARWVTAGDAGSLARAIEAALEDSRDTLERRDRGIARAAGFTWERTARLTAEVYRRSLRTRGKNP